MMVPPPVGPVVRENRWYVERDVTRQVENFLVQGVDVNLVGGWQSGKTSVLYALRDAAEPREWATAYVDLSSWTDTVNHSKWYELLAVSIHESLLPNRPSELVPFNLQSHTYIIEYGIRLVRAVQPHWPVVLMFDEVAGVPPDIQRAFFPAIRSLQNLRRDRAAPRELGNLLFVFSGQFSPDRLITHSHNSPFNQARTVDITEDDFTINHIEELSRAVGVDVPAEIIWRQTSGHPYLTTAMMGLSKEGFGLDEAVMKILATDRHFANLGRELSTGRRATAELAVRLAEGEAYPFIPSMDVDLDRLVTVGLVKSDIDGNAVIRCELYRLFISRSKYLVNHASSPAQHGEDRNSYPPAAQQSHSINPDINRATDSRASVQTSASSAEGGGWGSPSGGNADVPSSPTGNHHTEQHNMAQATPTRTQVFISYSHSDAPALQRLQVHLRPLERAGVVERWDDTRIGSGQRWREEIRKALSSSKVAVLLVSADFLASDFIASDELPHLLAAEANEGLVIMPVIISPCRFSRTASLSQFQAVNPPDRPLSSLSIPEQEFIWVKLTEDIEAVLQQT